MKYKSELDLSNNISSSASVNPQHLRRKIKLTPSESLRTSRTKPLAVWLPHLRLSHLLCVISSHSGKTAGANKAFYLLLILDITTSPRLSQRWAFVNSHRPQHVSQRRLIGSKLGVSAAAARMRLPVTPGRWILASTLPGCGYGSFRWYLAPSRDGYRDLNNNRKYFL